MLFSAAIEKRANGERKPNNCFLNLIKCTFFFIFKEHMGWLFCSLLFLWFFICINFDLFLIITFLYLYLLHFIVIESLIGRLFWYCISSTCAGCLRTLLQMRVCAHVSHISGLAVSFFPKTSISFALGYVCKRFHLVAFITGNSCFFFHSNNKRSMIWHHNAIGWDAKSVWERRSDSFKTIK